MCRRIMHSCCMCAQKQECSKIPSAKSPLPLCNVAPPPPPLCKVAPPTNQTNQPPHALSCAWSCARLARARPSRSRPTRCRQSCRSERCSRRVRRLGGRRRRRPGSNCLRRQAQGERLAVQAQGASAAQAEARGAGEICTAHRCRPSH